MRIEWQKKAEQKERAKAQSTLQVRSTYCMSIEGSFGIFMGPAWNPITISMWA